VLAREFLLQFADQAALDLLEFGVLAERHEDDVSLFASGRDGHILGGDKEEFPQFTAEVFGGHFELNECTSDLLLEGGETFIVGLEALLEVVCGVCTHKEI
jgi:hypothetical protein